VLPVLQYNIKTLSAFQHILDVRTVKDT